MLCYAMLCYVIYMLYYACVLDSEEFTKYAYDGCVYDEVYTMRCIQME